MNPNSHKDHLGSSALTTENLAEAGGIPQSMVDALTKKFPTHADEEGRKAIKKAIDDADHRTPEELREFRDMQREFRRGPRPGMEKVLAARMHTYGENCPHCEGGYCLAFPNWSKK